MIRPPRGRAAPSLAAPTPLIRFASGWLFELFAPGQAFKTTPPTSWHRPTPMALPARHHRR